MSDSVKSIFKILIKIPVIIAISYLILNVFAFGISYVRLLGISYSVMQVAMENNYIPDEELAILNEHLAEIAPPALSATGSILQDGRVLTYSGNLKTQYGNRVTVGVTAKFRWLIPFDRTVEGLKEGDNAHIQDLTISENNNNSGELGWNTREINIIYTVPGLKYYPDM